MKNTTYYIIFEILRIEKELGKGSTIQIGERFVGIYNPKTSEIYFTDVNGQEWTFYDNITCKIISKF